MGILIRQFPGTHATEAENQRSFAVFGREHVIVRAVSDEISFSEHTAPLSLKSTRRGCEIYGVGSSTTAVEEQTYLILNQDQPYTSLIESTQPVESFCVFFREGSETEVALALTQPPEILLDDPEKGLQPPSLFFQTIRRRNDSVATALERLFRMTEAGTPSPLQIDEHCYTLLEAMLAVHQTELRFVEGLPLALPATRIEIYRRLARARDVLETAYAEPLTIARLAQTACLSRHHFLRLFKTVFALTPHQYLTRVRLDRAAWRLKQTAESVLEICLAVGFENPSSFARLFRQTFGCSPLAFRAANQPRRNIASAK